MLTSCIKSSLHKTQDCSWCARLHVFYGGFCKSEELQHTLLSKTTSGLCGFKINQPLSTDGAWIGFSCFPHCFANSIKAPTFTKEQVYNLLSCSNIFLEFDLDFMRWTNNKQSIFGRKLLSIIEQRA